MVGTAIRLLIRKVDEIVKHWSLDEFTAKGDCVSRSETCCAVIEM